MDDTVKLIIEMPKDYYEVMQRTEVILGSPRSGKTLMSVIYSAVANGTPLDDVKAEIRAEQEKYSHPLEIEHAIEILDNIGKESEDNE